MSAEAARSHLSVERMQTSESSQWFEDHEGNLAHKSGGFFRVVGVEYDDPLAEGPQTQPILDQPEIGLLCFLTSYQDQTMWVLVQAKVEPGNVNEAQLAPTVQATESNYRTLHGGKAVPYIESALNGNKVLYDGLQSEQNGCFFRKRNRNRVVQLDRLVRPENPSFQWRPLTEVLAILQTSNVVNTDARSVLACWLLTQPRILEDLCEPGSFAAEVIGSIENDACRHPTTDLENWLGELNRQWPRSSRVQGLTSLQPQWRWRDGTFEGGLDQVLQIRHIAVKCATREVNTWDQPILVARSVGRIATIVGRFDGVPHLLLQARLEAGNREGFELTTTVQTSSEEGMTDFERLYWQDVVAGSDQLFSFENSDEGGRFDQCISRYSAWLTDDPHSVHEGPYHRWVSVGQLARWIRQPNRLTNELRSTLSALISVGV